LTTPVRAVFLDRDGTLIEDPGYLNDPAQVRLLPGVAAAIRRLNDAGYLAIVVTNQSGIARGFLTHESYESIARRLEEVLNAEGARLDAQYMCPHLSEITGACDCRKPGTLLFRQAAERFGIDLTKSWWIGDRIRDVSPAVTLGGRGILVGIQSAKEVAEDWETAADFSSAVDRVLRGQNPKTEGKT
jgi:D-glycero-D-manno-heptose 1,7-bisphosphate phosphatase